MTGNSGHALQSFILWIASALAVACVLMLVYAAFVLSPPADESSTAPVVEPVEKESRKWVSPEQNREQNREEDDEPINNTLSMVIK